MRMEIRITKMLLAEPQTMGDHFKKQIDELKPSIDDLCGCGSNFKYKDCCKNVPIEFRTSWTELSIRERNLAFCRAIKDVLGLNSGKTWTDVRQEMNEEQIVELYQFLLLPLGRLTQIYIH